MQNIDGKLEFQFLIGTLKTEALGPKGLQGELGFNS